MRKSGVILAILVVLMVLLPAHPSCAQNLVTNGSFELDTAGTVFPNNFGAYSASAWRFFAVADATGTAVISSAAATDGAVGVELFRGFAGAGDSALDKDADGAREIIPKAQRVYQVLVDAKDGSLGTSNLGISAQFTTTSMNRGKGFDPSDAFETIGVNALSDNLGTLSVRMDVPDGDNSVYLDNVRVYDQTSSGNRVLNGGFENSDTRLVNWRYYSLNAGELLVTLDNDAHTGEHAARIERTNDFETNDAALDLWDDRVSVVPGEFIEAGFWIKKLSGDEYMRVCTKVVQFDSTGAFIKENYWYNSNPVETEYRHFSHIVGLTNETYSISINFMVGSNGGSDRYLGAYLLDDVHVNHTDNILSNNSFEELEADQELVSLADSNGWRFFAVGGAVGSAFARTAAATDGKVGIEFARGIGEGGDSGFDRDNGGLARVTLPQNDRPYKALVDVKDGGVYGGTNIFHLDTQFLDGTGTNNMGITIDPGEAFETFGINAGSGTDAQGSVRMDFRAGDAERSALLDNVRLYDVSRMDRMLNGGFENSASRLMNWRTFSVNPGEFTSSISTDADTGKYAARVERLAEGEGISDGGIDINDNWIVVNGGETLSIRFCLKKISGADDVRARVSLAQFDSTGAYLGGALEYSIMNNPGTSAYETYAYALPIDAAARYINVALRIMDEGGAQRIGAYLIDHVQVIRNQVPAFTGASISPAAPEDGDILIITTTEWTDGDTDGEGYLYQWKKNGTPISGATNPKLTSLDYAPGDSITCVVTAFDGIEQGNSIETGAVTVEPLGVTDWAQY